MENINKRTGRPKEKTTYKRRITEVEDSITVESEHVEDYVDVKLPKRHRFNNGGFITLFQKTMFAIATQADLTKGEMKLLLYLLGTAGIDNSVCTDLDILEKDLSMNKGNISRNIKGLVDRKIVVKNVGYRGAGVRYLPMELSINYDQLNYDLAYNGRIKEHSEKKATHPEIEAVSLKIIEQKQAPELPFHQTTLEEQIEKAEKTEQ